MRYFLLVNLLFLANLKERSIYEELDYFLEAGDDTLEGDGLVDEAIRDLFTLL